jgi:hypothetical protein
MNISKTNAPWPFERILPMERLTRQTFNSSLQYIEKDVFQDKYSEIVSSSYLIQYEQFLQEMNVFFDVKKIGGDIMTFKTWCILTQTNPKTPDKIIRTFECQILLCILEYSTNTDELVVSYVCSRPCIEGLGFYKIFLWQLMLICRKNQFKRLLLHFCVPENFEILRSYFGFDEETDTNAPYVHSNCYMTLEKIQSIGYELPWRLETLIDSWDIHLGIKLKNYDAFAYASQLNNEYYVNEKFRNTERGVGRYLSTMSKVNLNIPFYGYPSEAERNTLNKHFNERQDSLLVALSLSKDSFFVLPDEITRLPALAPVIPVNPKPDHPYMGYPIERSNTPKIYTYAHNNVIKNSAKQAALHLPIELAGYNLRRYEDGALFPDYIDDSNVYKEENINFPKKLESLSNIFGTTSGARNAYLYMQELKQHSKLLVPADEEQLRNLTSSVSPDIRLMLPLVYEKNKLKHGYRGQRVIPDSSLLGRRPPSNHRHIRQKISRGKAQSVRDSEDSSSDSSSDDSDRESHHEIHDVHEESTVTKSEDNIDKRLNLPRKVLRNMTSYDSDSEDDISESSSVSDEMEASSPASKSVWESDKKKMYKKKEDASLSVSPRPSVSENQSFIDHSTLYAQVDPTYTANENSKEELDFPRLFNTDHDIDDQGVYNFDFIGNTHSALSYPLESYSDLPSDFDSHTRVLDLNDFLSSPANG